MTDSYPHMNKINDLAAQLAKELEDYKNNIYRAISYAAYCEIGTETEYWSMRGYEGESARDKANDELERYYSENGHETPYDDELKIIQETLETLKKLTLSGAQ